MGNIAKEAIERHFLIDIQVRRKTGQGPTGAVFAAPVTIKASVNQNPKLVRLPNGQQVAPSASIAFSIDEAEVPLGSMITTPGRAEAQVIQIATANGGGLPTPDHRMVYLG